MKRLLCLALLFMGLAVGCGPDLPDASTTPPPKTPEETTKELEAAMKSGKIDPATYGKQK